MNTDLRLSIGFRDHAKIVKLHKLLGEAGVASIVTLWAYVAAYRPKGILSGMDIADVEIAARWSGANGDFVATLHDLRLMDCPACKPGDLWDPHGVVLPVSIHDWEDWQPWAFRADERSAIAREKARKRWDKVNAKKEQTSAREIRKKEGGCKQHRKRMLLASKPDAAGNATASIFDAPLLSSPFLKDQDQKKDAAADAAGPLLRSRKGKGNGSDSTSPKPSARQKKVKEYPPEVLRLYAYYCETVVNVPAKKADTLRNIAARLEERFTEQQLGDAIAGYAEECAEKKTPNDVRYHSNNFFGKKGYFLGFLPEPGDEGADAGHEEVPVDE